MSERQKPKKRLEDTGEFQDYAEQQRLGYGKIEFDELGNAVWVPYAGVSGDDAVNRLLKTELSISDDDSQSKTNRIVKENPRGLRTGYDPYDSGMLPKKQSTKKKDLRRLSEWIKSNRKNED